MDPEAVRRNLQPTASAAEISGSNPPRLNIYDPYVINGVSLQAAEHGRVLCSFVVTHRLAEEIEVEGKLLRAGKLVGIVSINFRKKRTGTLIV